MVLDDDASDDSGSRLSIDDDLDFQSVCARKRSTTTKSHQPQAKTKTVYLQLSGDKYRCAIRSDATWEQLKDAIETRLGLPPAVARLASIRGARDGALIRTGHDIEAGEYLDIKLDLRELAKGKQVRKILSPTVNDNQKSPRSSEMMPDLLSTKSWVQSTNIRSVSTRCPTSGKDVKFYSHTNVSPWVQAASGTTILAPMITANKKPSTRPGSAPTSRSKSQHQSTRRYNESPGRSDTRYHGGSWSRVNLPQQTTLIEESNVTSNLTGIKPPNSGRIRPSSAPAVRSVVTPMQPKVPIAVAATEAMTAVFSNPMDPRQRQQYRQMGEFESQQAGRVMMAHQLQESTKISKKGSKHKHRSNSQMNPGAKLPTAGVASKHTQRSRSSKQPWLPTRNCNHRSAIISEEYPMMSHDGFGGPSEHRSQRY